MKQYRIGQGLLALVLLWFGAMSAVSAATAPQQIVTYTIDGGGHQQSSGGRFHLSGTIGQADSMVERTVGQRTLTGGFWNAYPLTTPGDIPGTGKTMIFLPLVSR